MENVGTTKEHAAVASITAKKEAGEKLSFAERNILNISAKRLKPKSEKFKKFPYTDNK